MRGLKLIELLRSNSAKRKALKEVDPYHVKVISNITISGMEPPLSYVLLQEGIVPQIEFGSYDNIIQDSYQCQGVQLLIVHYDLFNLLERHTQYVESYTAEQVEVIIESIKSELDMIAENVKSIPLVIFDMFTSMISIASPLYVSKISIIENSLNQYITGIKPANMALVDTGSLIASIGVQNAFDMKFYYLSKTLFTPFFWKEYALAVAPLIRKMSGKIRKAIVMDCDNTLWKGILGEDGEQGIDMSVESKIGSIFSFVQKILVWLSGQGILICLCSKNNEDDVVHVLNSHPDMILKEENIVNYKINWKDKASNLTEIATDLNIGLDSLVFVDDSSFEIELINSRLPQVKTMQVPVELSQYPSALLGLIREEFYLTSGQDDFEKTKQYKAQVLRTKEKCKHSNLDEYLTSLQIEVTAFLNDEVQVPRISQLTQKTNQFNLTTRRYSEIEMTELMQKGLVYSFSVKDKFGSNGLTAVIIVHKNGTTAEIDSFLLSCRIMGRNIEYAILRELFEDLKSMGVNTIFASYIPTAKNKPVADLWPSMGFTRLSKDEDKEMYSFSLIDYEKRNIDYIKINKKYEQY